MKAEQVMVLFLFAFLHLTTNGQEKDVVYYSASDMGIRGVATEVTFDNYHRIDSVIGESLSDRLQQLSSNTAGLYVEFETSSTFIDLKWELDSYRILPNMTPLAVNGFDLYGINDERWQYVASGIAKDLINEVRIIRHMDASIKTFRLYFPLYTGVKTLQIGVDPSSSISPVETVHPKPKIAIYGSSITQGASASRPGMAYPSILGRSLQAEVYNFGFSGSAKMEKAMGDIIKNVPVDIYILDCVPNSSVEQIEKRTIPFVEKLRDAQPLVPILMVESVFRESGNWNKALGKRVNNQNKAFQVAYQELLKKGFRQLYYIPSEKLIGQDHEATTDGVHFSDLGHYRMAATLSEKLKEILNKQNE